MDNHLQRLSYVKIKQEHTSLIEGMVEFPANFKRSTSKLVISTAMRATGDGMGRIGGGSPCPAERYVSIASNIKVYIYISLCIHYCIAHKDFNVRFIEGELG